MAHSSPRPITLGEGVHAPPAYPRLRDLFKALAVMGVVAGLGMATISLRFQLVDWQVEARDLQGRLRQAEAELLRLRRDVAQLSKAERLMELAGETLGLAPVPPERITRLAVASERIIAWERLLGWMEPQASADPLGRTMRPLAEMLGRPEWPTLAAAGADKSVAASAVGATAGAGDLADEVPRVEIGPPPDPLDLEP